MKKRFCCLLLALVLVCGLLPATADAATLQSGIVYEVRENYVAITDYVGSAEKLTIPAWIDGLPVTVIADFAFELSFTLKEVIIPSGVTSLGYGSFSFCENLTSITLPNTLTTICKDAFSYCSSLDSISLPKSLTTIGDFAFQNCDSLNSILIPEGVTYIGEYSFQNCDSLGSVSIPASTTFIGLHAFSHCNSLVLIEVDPDNFIYRSQDGALYSKDMTTLHCCPGGVMGSFTVPASVHSLQDAFDGCYSLTDIQVEEGSEYFCSLDGVLYYVDQTVLARCPVGRRGSFVIPDHVTWLDAGAFEECGLLTDITIPDSITAINGWVFLYCTNLTSVSLPDTLTYIGPDAFHGCSSLTNINIPDSVTEIEIGAFSDCSSLTNINIPEGVSYIGDYTFSGCTSLQSIDLPDSVTSIGDIAFAGSDSLTEITIPASVTAIYDGAFAGSGLSYIRFKGNAPSFGESVFNGVTATAYYPVYNATWTDSVLLDYGGVIKWVPYEPGNPFRDVTLYDFYHDPVLWALENGITNGLTATEFGPFANCNRAQVVTFLWRAAGCPRPTSSRNPFVDVAAGSFYEKAVLWAVEEGITNGADATHFNPTGMCNRAQVVTFLYRAFGSPAVSTNKSDFTDVPAGSWYAAPVIWAVENNITTGLTPTVFGPNSNCNRAQVVTFLYRAYVD